MEQDVPKFTRHSNHDMPGNKVKLRSTVQYSSVPFHGERELHCNVRNCVFLLLQPTTIFQPSTACPALYCNQHTGPVEPSPVVPSVAVALSVGAQRRGVPHKGVLECASRGHRGV